MFHVIGSLMEFLKIWQSNQTATLSVNCDKGEANISFNASFKNQKVKNVSPSKQRRNLRRAEAFHQRRFNSDDFNVESSNAFETDFSDQEPMNHADKQPVQNDIEHVTKLPETKALETECQQHNSKTIKIKEQNTKEPKQQS